MNANDLQFADSDFAKQAQMTASQFAKSAQQAGKNASDGFNRFVEGQAEGQGRTRATGEMDENRKSFWDGFSDLADQKQQQPTNIGTSAMGMGKNRQAGPTPPQTKKRDDGWDDW